MPTYLSGFEVSSQKPTIGIDKEVFLVCPRLGIVITTIAVITSEAFVYGRMPKSPLANSNGIGNSVQRFAVHKRQIFATL